MPRTITRWEPFAELADLRARFDRLFGELTDGHEREWVPAIDMERDDGNLVIKADVPGIKPEEIDIEVDRGVLTLSGKHEETKEEKDKTYVRRERRYGAFSRSVALPEGVDPAKITATTRDGLLEISVPVPEETEPAPVTITPTAAD